ncbi:MAG: hypothetical protein EOO99_11645 [Pedobacter sp.]|nr:MAG: hypothetical protein EOO99_11645 [Pedobacter sp.]
MASAENNRVDLRKNKEIVEKDINLLNTMEDKVLFAETLLNPPAPNDALTSAMVHYNKLINSNTPIDF